MKQPYYEFSADSEQFKYSFLSEGKRTIRKGIFFERLEYSHLYNLALGDLNKFGELDASSKSNNGDMEKVLATTIQVMVHFFTIHPAAIIYVEGNTPSRTRLYQIVISREFELLSEQFTILGIAMGEIETFQVGKAYHGFAITLKK